VTLATDQRAIRLTGVGASEVGAIVGLDPHRTPFDVYAAKKGLVKEEWSDPRTGTPAQRLGHLLEPVVAELYEIAHPDVHLVSSGTERHPIHQFALATPDRLVFDASAPPGAQYIRLLEIKTKPWRTAREFGQEGTDQVPQIILCQVQWQMAVLMAPRCDVGVLIDGRDYREFVVHADAEVQATLLAEVEAFWRHHVEAGVAPEMVGRTVSDYLKAQFRMHDAEIVRADAKGEDALKQLLNARNVLAEAEAQKEQAENRVKALIGFHKGIQADCARATWSQARDAERPDWHAIAQQFRTVAELRGAAREDLDAITVEFTKIVPGARRFLFTPSKDA
jgi:putative phage-type endonuclease